MSDAAKIQGQGADNSALQRQVSPAPGPDDLQARGGAATPAGSDSKSDPALYAWYLWDYERSEVAHGPYKTGEAAGAVRREIEDDRNLWIVSGAQILQWKEELADAR